MTIFQIILRISNDHISKTKNNKIDFSLISTHCIAQGGGFGYRSLGIALSCQNATVGSRWVIVLNDKRNRMFGHVMF